MTAPGLPPDPLPRHPLDVIERLAEYNEWMFERRNDEEMAVQAPGRWCDYNLFFSWNADVGAMHFTCALDMRIPCERRGDIHELLARINEKLWLGHFGIWSEEGLPMFRHALPMRGASGPTMEQMEDLVETAIIECERFYPAFQYVVWAGRTPVEAIEAAMVETVGEA